MSISQIAREIRESPTLKLNEEAMILREKGEPVINMGVGEPTNKAPITAILGSAAKLKDGNVKYTPVDGTRSLKKAIIRYTEENYDRLPAPENVIVSTGAKQAIFNLLFSIIDPQDEVIILAPYWVSYPEMVKLAQGKPVFIEGKEQNEFKLTPDQIAARITPKTKLFVFNSPSNPGGFSYSPAETRAIADMLMDHPRVIVLSDEMYDRLLFTGQKYLSFAATRKEMYDRTVTFNAGSKTYSMTGWRIGYAAGPLPIIQNMAKIQSQTTSGTATFCQQALAVALKSDQACVDEMRQEFARRAEHMWKRLNAIPGVRCVRPTGAFYAFPNVSGAFKKLGVTNSLDFASKVLEQAHVALVPGSAFGADSYVRLSFATSMAQIDKGLDRLQKLLS
jgi:aspartate aminotransferase